MKIASLGPDKFDHTGIETVEKNLLKTLEEDPSIDLERVNPFWIQKDFPLSTTIDNILRNRVVQERIPQDVDKVLVPAQTRLNFNPEEVEPEVVVYVHDLFPQTHFFKFEEKRGWLYRNVLSYVGYRISTRFIEVSERGKTSRFSEGDTPRTP